MALTYLCSGRSSIFTVDISPEPTDLLSIIIIIIFVYDS